MTRPFPSTSDLSKNQHGLALVMVVFVVALATILVLELGTSTRFDQRTSRQFTEGIQAQFMLKSAVNLGRLLLEFPKPEGIQEDWLGEPWALIAAAPALPISGFLGDPRVMIVDDDGKLDLNAIVNPQSQTANPLIPVQPQNPEGTPGPTPASQAEVFWKNALRDLFLRAGFEREQYSAELYRTPGNVAYAAKDEVAVVSDWIDPDSASYSNPLFDGEGIESSADKTLFYNRPLRTLSELLLVPGMTRERLSKIAPFVRVSQNVSGPAQAKVNVNTAPLEVLMAMGFPESQAVEMVQERVNLPITTAILSTLVTGDSQLGQRTKVTSGEFSIYARVVMSNVTRWVKAVVSLQGPASNRRTNIRSIEFY